MKKIILSGIIVLSALVFTGSSANAKPLPPTNALAAWAEGYQYGMSHGWGHEDSLYWAKVQMKIWINNHS